MRTDKYTKFILTVICFCLVYLSLMNLLTVPKVRADAPIRVILVDGNDRPIAGGGGTMGLPLQVEASLPVHVEIEH
jgi:hypothetical protein